MGKTNLAPGFRFHPTDTELVRYYLKRKVLGKKFLTNAIAEIDVYKFEPPDLPDKSCLSGDLIWYFFCPRENKYPNGGKAKRSTEAGYWKVTGRDRDVFYNNEVVGRIKTLIFYCGKTGKGERTDWVMHEYRLEDKALAQKNVPQDAYVICKVFKKIGLGPRGADDYGGPFKEEDWISDGEEEEEEDNTKSLVAIENVDPGPSNAPQDGVISESCVCDVPRLTDSAVVVPPLVTSDVVAYTPMLSSSQADDDELYSMLDFFTVPDEDESLFLESFDNQIEVRHEPEPEIPVVEEAAPVSGIPELSDDLFIELQDLIGPVTPPPAQTGDSRSNGQS